MQMHKEMISKEGKRCMGHLISNIRPNVVEYQENVSNANNKIRLGVITVLNVGPQNTGCLRVQKTCEGCI